MVGLGYCMSEENDDVLRGESEISLTWVESVRTGEMGGDIPAIPG